VLIEEIVARSVGVAYPAINGLEIGDIAVPVPSEREQRFIADFLDVETTRIDRLTERRRAQLRLLEERRISMLSSLLVPGDVATVRLRYLAVLQGGLTVDAQREPGADPVTRPYLRVANVQPGWVELQSVTEIEVPRALADRCTLRTGDVLMTEGGDLDKLGRGTAWRGELPGALHQNHIFAVRPHPALLSSAYLALLTQTAHARAYFESTGIRTTNLASTNREKIMSLPVPSLSISEQESLVSQAQRNLAEIAGLESRLRRQVDLLMERRQALITAAVTGQIEIPGVAA
jgi:type I restriction enzyme S subunit